MSGLGKCIFYININLKAVCRTCMKEICYKKVISSNPRNSIWSIQGPQKLIGGGCLKNEDEKDLKS